MRHWVGCTVNSADTLHVNFLQIMAKTKYNITTIKYICTSIKYNDAAS